MMAGLCPNFGLCFVVSDSDPKTKIIAHVIWNVELKGLSIL